MQTYPIDALNDGWSCDARYGENQIPYYAKNYRVLVLDLAGHGRSGQTRKTH